jgi:hypothetical protein
MSRCIDCRKCHRVCDGVYLVYQCSDCGDSMTESEAKTEDNCRGFDER